MSGILFAVVILFSGGTIFIMFLTNRMLRAEVDEAQRERGDTLHEWRTCSGELRRVREEFTALKAQANDDFLRVKSLTAQANDDYMRVKSLAAQVNAYEQREQTIIELLAGGTRG